MKNSRTVVRAAPATLLALVAAAGGLTACETDNASSSDAAPSNEPMNEPAATGTTSGGSGNPFISEPGDTRSPWATGGRATAGGGSGVEQGDTGSGVTSGRTGGAGPQSNAAPTTAPQPTPSAPARPAAEPANDWTADTNAGTNAGNEWIEPAEDAVQAAENEWTEASTDSDWSNTTWDEPETTAQEIADAQVADAADWSNTQWTEPAATESAINEAEQAVAANANNEWVQASDGASEWASNASDDVENAWDETMNDATDAASTDEWVAAPSDWSNAADDAGAMRNDWPEDADEVVDAVMADAKIDENWPDASEFVPPEPPSDPFAALVDPLDDPGRADAFRAANYMTGVFSSAAQAAESEAFYDIRLRMVPIWRDRSDGPWIYVEQAAAETPNEPYRRRVYNLRMTSTGAVRSDVYLLPQESASLIGAWSNPFLFDSMSKGDLTLRDGCTVEMEYSEADDAFNGSTVGTDCVSTLNGAAYATSVVTLRNGEMTSWDRGFNADGDQVWGAEDDAYVFLREN